MAGGGMPSGEHDEDEGAGFTEPNIVPLVDIMLVLLVILMAGSSAIVQAGGQGESPSTGFEVTLPSATGDKAVSTVSDELIVTVLETGEIVIAGSVMTVPALTELFTGEAASNPNRLVLVQADQNAVHARVVEVMEIARRAGLVRLAIATRGADPDE